MNASCALGVATKVRAARAARSDPRVAAGEVDPVHLGEAIPGEIVLPPGNQPLALHDDRALPVLVEQRHRAPLRTVADHRLDLDAVTAQLLCRTARVVVVAEGGEEGRRPAQLGELHRGDRAAAGRLGPPPVRVHDLAGERYARHRYEVDPFDVPDHREPTHAGDDTQKPGSQPSCTTMCLTGCS